MAGAPSGTIFDWSYFAPERPAFAKIAQLSGLALSVCLIIVAALVFLAACLMRPIEKAVLLAWLVLP